MCKLTLSDFLLILDKYNGKYDLLLKKFQNMGRVLFLFFRSCDKEIF